MEPINTARAILPRFSRRWWGYDRKEVEEFLRQTAAERQRHQESLAWLEALMAGYDPQSREAALAAARREAHEARIVELRTTAGGCARAEAGPSRVRALPAFGSLRPVSRRHVYTLLICAALGMTLIAALRPDSRASEARGTPVPARQAAAPSKPSSVPAVRAPDAPAVATGSDALASDRPNRAVDPLTAGSSSPVAGTEGFVLTLTARRSCWIGTSIDGAQRLERLLEPYETVILHAHDEVVLRVGDADALSVLVNNRPMRPLGAAGQVVTRRISRENYLSMLVP